MMLLIERSEYDDGVAQRIAAADVKVLLIMMLLIEED